MNWGAIIIIVGLVFFLGVIPLVLLQSQQRKKKYGPKRQTGGLKVMQGSLVCQNWKAPTLGKKLRRMSMDFLESTAELKPWLLMFWLNCSAWVG